MEANSENIFSANAHDIKKIKNKKHSIYSILIALFGVILFIVTPLFIADNTSASYLLLITLAVVLIVFGIVRFAFGGNEYIYTQTKSKLEQVSLFFKPGESQSLMYAIETGNFDSIHKLQGQENSGLRLDMLISKDKQFATCQIFAWIPYNYQAVSTVYKLQPNIVSNLSSYIEKHLSKTQK